MSILWAVALMLFRTIRGVIDERLSGMCLLNLLGFGSSRRFLDRALAPWALFGLAF